MIERPTNGVLFGRPKMSAIERKYGKENHWRP